MTISLRRCREYNMNSRLNNMSGLCRKQYPNNNSSSFPDNQSHQIQDSQDHMEASLDRFRLDTSLEEISKMYSTEVVKKTHLNDCIIRHHFDIYSQTHEDHLSLSCRRTFFLLDDDHSQRKRMLAFPSAIS